MVPKHATHKTTCALALAAALASSAAQAADLPSRKSALTYVAPPPVFSWTGFYAGLNIGDGFSASNAFSNYLGGNGGSVRGLMGGGQAGYNYQVTPLFVVGVEEDFQATGISNHNAWNSPSVSMPWYGTGRARAGVSILDSRLLVYGTGGLAAGQLDDAAIKKLRIGWTAGGGVEWAFLPNWSAKAEYLYAEFKHDGLPDWNRANVHTVRVGVNYHFDLFSLMP
ncbi:MAG: outer membrane protein [Methylovirgula sp.]